MLCFFLVRVVIKLKSIIMKKLSIAIVLVSASFGFAKAQTTEAATTKAQTTQTATAEMKIDTAAGNAAVENITVEPVKAEEAAVKVEEIKKQTPAETKQKARMEKKEAKKLVE